MNLLAIGTKVRIDGDIPATIRAVTIYSEHWVKYLCVYWDERNRREEWLSPDEFTPKEPARVQPVKFQ